MNKIEFLHNIDKYKGEDHSTFLQHYGILGQKWGQRRWQNADGTFNEAGKERYFGKKNSSDSSDEDKVSGMKSDVKDYLKFRNKMLKKRTTEELNKWYRENNKAADKQMLKDAKKVDKQRDKFYKNQLKDFYDDPNELVSDLDRIYKVGESPEEYQAKMKKLNSLAEDFGLPTGNFEITNGIGVIKRANQDIYNGTVYLNGKEKPAMDVIADNKKVINKMIKALDDRDWETYQKIRNSNFKTDEEKDLCEGFIDDVRVYKEIQNIKKETAKEIEDMQKGISKGKINNIKYNDEVNVRDMKNENRNNIIVDNKAKERVQDFVDNRDKYINKIADKIADYWLEDGKITIYERNGEKELTKNEFMKRFKDNYAYYGNVQSDGSIYFDFSDDGMFGGHGILAIIEPDGNLHKNTGSLQG